MAELIPRPDQTTLDILDTLTFADDPGDALEAVKTNQARLDLVRLIGTVKFTSLERARMYAPRVVHQSVRPSRVIDLPPRY